jgi:predicted small lipoprotein YifL
MKKLMLAAVIGVFAATAAGCGEKQPVTVYKQGQYQGKPDSRPWDNDQFKNDRTAWEKAIKARNGSQNEYARAAN